ncbi:MAG: hypothetical protein JF615_14205 [Asticcacaulis sp.]|nr:hypothetical protein [Asticcacaulis sp.]
MTDDPTNISNDLEEFSGNADVILRAITILIATILGAAIIISCAVYIYRISFADWETLFRTHFSVVIGLPCAAAIAFSVVQFLRQTDGPIEFEGLGFKFKGAAGQVVMWVLCFLVIVLGVKALW